MKSSIKIKLRGNLRSLISFLEYLGSIRYLNDFKAYFERERNLLNVRRLVQIVVEQEIYKFGTSTGRIGRSFKAVSSGFGGRPKIIIYSDPSVAPSKGPFESGDPGSFSYAAFFEQPIYFSSFIPVRGQLTSNRYRPFMDQMTHAVADHMQDEALKSALFKMKQKLPRGRGGGRI